MAIEAQVRRWGARATHFGIVTAFTLFAAFPFWVALFSHFMLADEKLLPATIAGMVVCFLGVVVLFWEDLGISNHLALYGMGAIVASVIIQALSLVQVKKWGAGMSPVVQNFVGMVIGLVLLGIVGFVLEGNRTIVWTAPANIRLVQQASMP